MPRFALAAALLALVLAATSAAAQAVPPIPFHERTLANGLKVITSLDRTTPNVTVQVWYGVGAKNDPPGRSGFAHLFEHMMFKATRDMPAENIDRLTEDVGGMNNAFTQDDNTTFYEVIPAAHLQRLLWAEAQRMSGLVVDAANFKSEREVVKEELRQRVLADPYGRFVRYLIPDATFQVHPYRRSAIGSIEDLDAATLDDVQTFHATYYRPDNAALVVAGNFDAAQLDAWVEQYFGAIKDPPTPMPKVTAIEPPRTGPKSVTGYGPTVPLPAIAVTWLAPAATSPDGPALQVLDAVLSAGKSSRLYDALVYDKQVAAEVFSSADLRAQPGMFYVGAVVAQGHTVDEVETALRVQVAALTTAPVSAAELERAKTQLLTSEVRQRETIDGRANELGESQIVEGDAARANTDIANLTKVTAADVERVAAKYLPDNLRAVIRYLPESQKPAGAPVPPPASAPIASKPFTGVVAELAPQNARQAPPPIGPQPSAILPTPAERRLANGLRVIVAKSSDVPLVSANLVLATGAEGDPPGLSGAADLTADLVTEGAGGRSARDIARQTEALGAELSASSAWEASSVSLTVMADKLNLALPIMADVVERPTFAAAELERARTEAEEALQVAYDNPEQVAAYATAPVVYAGTPFAHAADGTAASLKRLTRADLAGFHDTYWRPDNAILVLTGDITPTEGFALAERTFGDWAKPAAPLPPHSNAKPAAEPRAVAIDLPGTGQAQVVVAKSAITRTDPRFYQALVANAVLGGGYSARLNEEVRVKRGLSYGASSSLAARRSLGAVTALAETRNESAGDVIGLMEAEMTKLGAGPPTPDELTARKSSLIGEYGRTIATTAGLSGQLAGLALYDIDLGELGRYTDKVQSVTGAEVEAFAHDQFDPARASLIVVGDGKTMLPGLKATANLDVIPIKDFDPDSPTLRTSGQ